MFVSIFASCLPHFLSLKIKWYLQIFKATFGVFDNFISKAITECESKNQRIIFESVSGTGSALPCGPLFISILSIIIMAWFPDSFLKCILTFYCAMILDFETVQASGSVFVHICVLNGLLIFKLWLLPTGWFCFTFLVIAAIIVFLSKIRIL